MISATAQPIIACGPFMADIRAGMVMNGPTPIMFVMFNAVACNKPKRGRMHGRHSKWRR